MMVAFSDMKIVDYLSKVKNELELQQQFALKYHTDCLDFQHLDFRKIDAFIFLNLDFGL